MCCGMLSHSVGQSRRLARCPRPLSQRQRWSSALALMQVQCRLRCLIVVVLTDTSRVSLRVYNRVLGKTRESLAPGQCRPRGSLGAGLVGQLSHSFLATLQRGLRIASIPEHHCRCGHPLYFCQALAPWPITPCSESVWFLEFGPLVHRNRADSRMLLQKVQQMKGSEAVSPCDNCYAICLTAVEPASVCCCYHC